MSPVAWMIGLCVLSWIGLTAATGDTAHPEVFWGMLGPLAGAVLTWVTVVRTHRRTPERVTGVLAAGFGVKLVLFAAYMAVMLRVLGLRVVPFAVAFVGYMVVLYVLEALFLKRLFVDGIRSAPGA